MQGFRACGRSVQFVRERINPTALLTGAIAGRQRKRYSSSPCVGGDDGPLLMLSSACRCARGSAQYPATGLCTLPQPDSGHAGSVGRADRQGEAADETE